MRSVSRRSGAEKRATTIQATSTTRPTIHARPVRPMFRGSGGGAPVGRRRPGVRRTVGGTDEVGTPVPPSPIAGSIGAAVTGAPSVACERRGASRGADCAGTWRGRGTQSARQPGCDDRRDVVVVAELAVQVAHGLGRQPRRGRVDDIGDPGSPPIDQLGADQRRDVLGRLQPAIVGELDEVRVVEDRIGGEQQPDVDVALAQRLHRERPAGVEAEEAVEGQPVHVGEADEAQRTSRAFGRTTEREPRRRRRPGR